jgi:adenosylhomocysteine nucleosidase
VTSANATGIAGIAIVVAMPSELQHLPGLPGMPTHGDSPWPTVEWAQGGLDRALIECGSGMIRAAAATEHVIVTWQPDIILNFGCAGAHRADVRVGDVVIGTRSVAHGSMVIPRDGLARFDQHDGAEPPPPGSTGVPSAPALIAIAREAAAGWTPDPWHGISGDNDVPRVHEGIVASADVWTQAHTAIETLAERHQSSCEDMEAAAIATVCALHDVPFLTIKDISNNELLKTTIFDPEMGHLPEPEVGRRAAALTGRVIDAIAHGNRQTEA